MPNIRESLYFLRQFGRSARTVGSLIPTSRFAARAMASEMARRSGPRRILEVGAGTGAITAEIARAMGPDDTLDAYELNPEFVGFLRRRLEEDARLAARRDRITLHQGDVLEMDRGRRFDFIVSAIPFVNCPPEVVENILALYRDVLEPDGVLSFIEYAYLRRLKLGLLADAPRRQAEASIAVMNRDVEPYVFRRDLVLRNLPPAWIRHLRFHDPGPQDALDLAPLPDQRRVALGERAGMALDGLPFAAAILGAGWLLRRVPGAMPLAGISAAAAVAFFRDPDRPVAPDPDVAYAAADGRVLAVERVRDARFGPGEWLRVAVFLALTDVHVNRSPVAGKVADVVDEAGGFANAAHPAAEHNRARYTVIDGVRDRCVVAQRAGILARRIVSWARPGELVAQGERFGLIRFGSRTDVYLPAERWAPCVTEGERVVGGVSAVARFGGGPR